MQFITRGPEIPDALLQAHEEGRVVFFCGAGISYPAGLPLFKGMVEQIYELLGETFEDIEHEAFKRCQYDATLDLLERRIRGHRLAVRRKLAEVLEPKLLPGATATHESLLRLARNRDDSMRLVTTNFDRLFHEAASSVNQRLQEYAAPMLPIPKNSRWNGLVFLHGLLPKDLDESALERLIVTSGDFGLAYLTERWAARFVSELFRNYLVCFIGYGINDPVLRYMRDALAADRLLGEVTPTAWALGHFTPGQELQKTKEWKAKGVTPILYEVPAETNDHSALHKTIQAWADTYRDGVSGKERVVISYALAHPSSSTQQDDFVGRMLWAMSDKTGLPARRFADFNPAPPLEWLFDAFSVERFQHDDLTRFRVPPEEEKDTNLRFSLIRRPTPYKYAAAMSLASFNTAASQWDDVMSQIARWLLRYLDDPRLILWIVQRGCHLHDRWKWLIERELDRITSLEFEGRTLELEQIRTQSPKAIPSQQMRKVWRMLLSGKLKTHAQNHDLYYWRTRIEKEGLTVTSRFELRKLLTPLVAFKKPIRWLMDSENSDNELRLKQFVDWELVLASNHVDTALHKREGKGWEAALPHLLEDFQQLLRDALDLQYELSEANERTDRSYWDLPSISSHWQNRGFRDWVTLIELLRDSWLAVRTNDSARATRIARTWYGLPYATFKRLALFSASQDGCVNCDVWVDWLLTDDSWGLWSIETRREVLRLLVLQGNKLTGTVQERLETAIMAGTAREKYRDDLEAEQWEEIVAHSIWLRLAKLNSSGLALSQSAKSRLTELSIKYPQWQLAANESDEFSHWSSGTGDPDYGEYRTIDKAPLKRIELVQWLKKPPSEWQPFYEDTWSKVCSKHPLNCLCALTDLAKQGIWPSNRWKEALYSWSNRKNILRMYRHAAPEVLRLPDNKFKEIIHGISWWLKVVSKSLVTFEAMFLELCRRVIAQSHDSNTGITRDGKSIAQPITEAINHPVGHVTEALINLWFIRNPNDNDLLPTEIKPIFTELCNTHVARYCHGRVLLCSRMIALFRIDHSWTEQHILPLLNWESPKDAVDAWSGFLWSPRLFHPLLIAFKQQFLECAKHYEDLGEQGQQFAAFLTYLALEPPEEYSADELQLAFRALPTAGLEESAQALSQAIEGVADKREEYWKNRVRPFWNGVWPKSSSLATPRIAEYITRIIIAARLEFPSAMVVMQDWLQPVEHLFDVVDDLLKSGLCKRFPTDALRLLNSVIAEQPWPPDEIEQCLDEIVKASPDLDQDHRYQRLCEYLRIQRK